MSFEAVDGLDATRARQLAAALVLADAGFGIVEVATPTTWGDCTCPASSYTRRDRPDRTCASPGKHPVGEGWPKSATTDPVAIRAMAAHPLRQFGALPQAGSGLLVVDEDRARALEELGPLPDTLTVATSKGRHVYGRLPDGVAEADLPRSWEGGDVRIAGSGIVVAPWSTHASGVVYMPIGTTREVRELPTAFVDAVITSARRMRTRQDAARQPTDPGWKVTEGGRHDLLKRKARHLRGVGLSGSRLLDELLRLNRERCEPPKSDEEVADLVGWVEKNITDDPPEVVIRTGEVRPALAGIDAVDLLALDLPPLRWIVPDLLPEGTTVLAAPPKVGKSCLVYQIAAEVALGGRLFGRSVDPGSVLYLALEDGQRRGQARLRAALHGRAIPRGRLEVRWSAPRIGSGLEDELEAWLDAHPDARFVGVDTLQRVRPRHDGKRNAYEVDVEDVGRLQDRLRDRAVSLTIVHHSKKESGDDFLASVGGTYGITGSADTVVVVRRKRLEAFGTIVVTGRDVPEAELAARFDGMLWWEAPHGLAEASFSRLEIYREIERSGPAFPKAIADQVGLERTNVQHLVEELVRSGAVARTVKGYVVSTPPSFTPVTPEGVTGTPPRDPFTPVTVESEGSDGVPTRARAREVDEPVQCSSYAEHRSAHRRVGDRWVCDRCPDPVAPGRSR